MYQKHNQKKIARTWKEAHMNLRTLFHKGRKHLASLWKLHIRLASSTRRKKNKIAMQDLWEYGFLPCKSEQNKLQFDQIYIIPQDFFRMPGELWAPPSFT